MTKRSIVFGASGFVGRNFLRALNLRGECPIAVLRKGGSDLGPREGLSRLVLESFGDHEIRTSVDWETIDCIINFAASGVMSESSYGDQLFTNSLLPSVLTAIGGYFSIPIINLGSSSEYGDTTVVPGGFHGRGSYAVSKNLGWTMSKRVADDCGAEGVHLRLFNAYGPGEPYHRLLTSLLRSGDRKERVSLSEGKQVRDFIYIDDVVSGVLAVRSFLLENGLRSYRSMDLCTGIGTTVRDFVIQFGKARNWDENLLGFGDLEMRANEVLHSVGNPEELRDLCGFHPSISLAEGFSRAVIHWNDGWQPN